MSAEFTDSSGTKWEDERLKQPENISTTIDSFKCNIRQVDENMSASDSHAAEERRYRWTVEGQNGKASHTVRGRSRALKAVYAQVMLFKDAGCTDELLEGVR